MRLHFPRLFLTNYFHHQDEKFLNARSNIDFLKAVANARELRYRQDNEKVQK